MSEPDRYRPERGGGLDIGLALLLGIDLGEGELPARSLPSQTERVRTELGNLYLTVTFDEGERPFELFGWIGKTGSFGHGMTELACRLLSLHLRRGTLIDEIIDQCRGIRDMAPTPNVQDDGTVVWNTGVGDAIAQVLRKYSDELEGL